jgi:YD repeat-containing protein
MSPPAGDSAVTNYDDSLRQVTVCRGSQCTLTLHDGIGSPVSVTTPAGVTSITKYDKDGRKSFNGSPGGGDTNGDTYSYDALNRVTQVCHPGSPCRSMLYESNTVTITDENNHRTIQRFQAFGSPSERRLVAVRDAETPDSCSGDCEWEYSYTTLGALRSVNPPAGGPMRTWSYDPVTHLLTSESQPESGTTTYQYDDHGRLAWKSPGGQAHLNLRHLYDPNGRLTTIDQIPASGHFVEFEYDASDNRTRVRNALVDSKFIYDAANRLMRREDTIGTRTFVTHYSYDGRDQLTEIEYPSGRKVTYTPNASTGRIESVKGPGSVTYASAIQYHPSGALSGLTFGNGTTESIGFDNRHRPDHLQVGPRLTAST